MPLVILDRDGVINEDSDDYIKSVDEWQPITGSIEAIARLSQAGYQVAIATNQSGIARRLFTVETLDAMHQKMRSLVTDAGGEIAHIAYCPHGPDDQCDCRKPLPGLIHQIEVALSISVHRCWLVGDSLRDLQAGVAAGCNPALVLTGKGEKTRVQIKDTDQPAAIQQTPVFRDLSHFVDHLLGV